MVRTSYTKPHLSEPGFHSVIARQGAIIVGFSSFLYILLFFDKHDNVNTKMEGRCKVDWPAGQLPPC